MNKYYTVEQIAAQLSMHPKTIQRYIREGKIHAKKVGKSWRIYERELNNFLQGSSTEECNNAAPVQDKILISSVIDIRVQDFDEAANLERMLVAALNSKPYEFGKSTMRTQYLEYEDVVRISLWGNFFFMQEILEIIPGIQVSR